jgi:hypothetical protein
MTRLAAASLLALLVTLVASTHAAADAAVQCEIRENGEPASGTMLILDGTRELGEVTCGKPLTVPAGSYTAVLRLDGAIDGPEQRVPLVVGKDAPKPVKADFATGTLEVKVTSESKAAAGMAIIRKDGKQIGTLGSGVPAHLSAGTYEIVVRHRSESKTLASVVIAKGDKKTLDVSFP